MTAMMRYLRKAVAERKRDAEDIAAQMQKGLKALEAMKDGSKIRYQIQLSGGWDGEKNVTLERRGSLKAAMQAATVKYKTVNKRMDVQAQCRVYAMIPGMRPPVVVPEKLWKKLFKEFAADETRR